MSGFYRGKRGISTFWQDNGFYVILTVTLILVCAAGYIAFTWDAVPDDEQLDEDTPTDITDPDTSVLPDPNEELNADPNEEVNSDVTPGEEDANVNVTVDNIPAELEATDETAEAVIVEFAIPVAGAVKTNYSGVNPVFSETMGDWRTHNGIDFISDEEVDVIAAADGIVEDVYSDELMGVTVVIKHLDDSFSIYQSLAENPRVLKGSAVSKGDIIGKTGNTAEAECLEGIHLHFAVINEGKYTDPNDRFITP